MSTQQISPSARLRAAKPSVSPWTPYWIEAALLGSFMISACVCVAMLEHPASPIHTLIASAFFRRMLTGLAMGATAVVLIYSPWGKQSGAHMNPAVTICFLRLSRIKPTAAALYVLAQFIGGAAGVALCKALIGPTIAHPAVGYVATVPGMKGVAVAWAAEFGMGLILMATILQLNGFPRLLPWTGWVAGALVALYITFEAPLSGMSINPARTFASAVWADVWTGWWIYFTAPVLGMLAAVEFHIRLARHPHLLCGRLTHCQKTPTPFQCNCRVAAGIKAGNSPV